MVNVVHLTWNCVRHCPVYRCVIRKWGYRGVGISIPTGDVMWLLLVLRSQTLATVYVPYSMFAMCIYVFHSDLVVAILLVLRVIPIM